MVVLPDTFAVPIHDTYVVLGQRIPPFRRLAVPRHRFIIVLLNAPSFLISAPHVSFC